MLRRATLAHRRTLRTRILYRKVMFVKQKLSVAAIVCLAAACARLQPLTPDRLTQAEAKWKVHPPQAYQLVIEMSGDRIETGRLDVSVQQGQVITLRRNNLAIRPNGGQDYSMEGLFHMLE